MDASEIKTMSIKEGRVVINGKMQFTLKIPVKYDLYCFTCGKEIKSEDFTCGIITPENDDNKLTGIGFRCEDCKENTQRELYVKMEDK